jgi:heat-inducible transcriptional repressor
MILDERNKKVLFSVIQCYINSPGPVGSRVVTKRFSLGLSPATIRNVMSDLEEMGFLAQPHTSAGRVPTDSGYRFYVDVLKEEKRRINKDLIDELSRNLELLRKDINAFPNETSKVLSSLSHYIGIAMSQNTGQTTLSKIELIKYKKTKLAVILFTDDSTVSNKIVSIDSDISQKDLNRIADYINAEFTGYTLDEIRESVIKEMKQEKRLYDKLITEAVKICREVFSASPGNLYISGLSEMIDLPDFCDIQRIRELLKAIDDKRIVLNLLENMSASEGTQVFIGSENPLTEMKEFSLVVSTYKEGNKPIGTIGIIGPKRMNYLKAISIVDATAHYITNMLMSR